MAAPRKAKWYFDFISPFAYFHLKLLQARRVQIELEPVPVLFAGILKSWGQKGPAEIEPKRRYSRNRHSTRRR